MVISAIAYHHSPTTDPNSLCTNRQFYALAGIAEVLAWIGFGPSILKSNIPDSAKNMILGSRVQNLFPSPTTQKIARYGAVLFLLLLIWHKNKTDSGGSGTGKSNQSGPTIPNSFSSNRTNTSTSAHRTSSTPSSENHEMKKIDREEMGRIAAYMDNLQQDSGPNGATVSDSINFDDDE